jgi:hypothetical protein
VICSSTEGEEREALFASGERKADTAKMTRLTGAAQMTTRGNIPNLTDYRGLADTEAVIEKY